MGSPYGPVKLPFSLLRPHRHNFVMLHNPGIPLRKVFVLVSSSRVASLSDALTGLINPLRPLVARVMSFSTCLALVWCRLNTVSTSLDFRNPCFPKHPLA